ncbi:MAG TPA: FHA domain-containing protein, partial [Burkholderiaceae bacterium]
MSAAVVEVLGRDGRVLAVHKVQSWPLRIGRSPDADLVLVDAHVAATHARIDWSEEGANLVMLESLNGGRFGERQLKVGEAVALGLGADFQLGATRL